MNSKAEGRCSPSFPGTTKAVLHCEASQPTLNTSRLPRMTHSKSSTPPLSRSGPIYELRAQVREPPKQPLRPPRTKSASRADLEPLLEEVRTAAKVLTVHAIKSIRELPSPSDNDRKVCGAFLSLFSEIDDRIEATPSFKVLNSAFWDAMVSYAAQPGHVTQMVRRFPELVFSGKISDGSLHTAAATRARNLLGAINEASLRHKKSALLPLFQYTKACVALQTAASSSQLSARSSRQPQLRKAQLDSLANPTFTLSDARKTLGSLSYSESKENSPMKVDRSLERAESPVDTVRELQWRLDDALRLFLREKLWAQPDVVSFVESQGDELMREFSESVLYVTRDLPEPLQTAGVKPFLASLRKATVLQDVVRVITMLTPCTAA